MIGEYQLHELAVVFPEMSGDEYAALRDSIAEIGQQDPVLLLEGKILDGRHRARACAELGLPLIAREVAAGVDPMSLVTAGNLARRHMDVGQRAMVAMRLSERSKRGRVAKSQNVGIYTQAEAGAALGVSPEYLRQARRLVEFNPGFGDALQAGGETIRGCWEIKGVLQRFRDDTWECAETGMVDTLMESLWCAANSDEIGDARETEWPWLSDWAVARWDIWRFRRGMLSRIPERDHRRALMVLDQVWLRPLYARREWRDDGGFWDAAPADFPAMGAMLDPGEHDPLEPVFRHEYQLMRAERKDYYGGRDTAALHRQVERCRGKLAAMESAEDAFRRDGSGESHAAWGAAIRDLDHSTARLGAGIDGAIAALDPTPEIRAAADLIRRGDYDAAIAALMPAGG